jgi:hypothetical protein
MSIRKGNEGHLIQRVNRYVSALGKCTVVNHAEAFFSALRRKCATFRRKTNMYAKSTQGLQRLLRVYWVVHNFLRVHFTTREVPAVALGILERRLTVQEIFQVQMA